MSEPLVLTGLDGGNPLAFLALLGVGLISRCFCCPDVQISWTRAEGGWRPRLHGFDGDEEAFLDRLYDAMLSTSPGPFEIDKKLPFARDDLRAAMQQCRYDAGTESRRMADILAGFGTDAQADKKGMFVDTAFRMVRRGDSAGQGLPAYGLAIRKALTRDHVRTTLFSEWQYEDEGFNLRWDPVEDQRYALRWYDPSPQSNKRFGLRAVQGANALALEGLGLLPVQPSSQGVATTGFSRKGKRREFFTWPIWEIPLSPDMMRSLLTIPELAAETPDRRSLGTRGVAEVYRSERIAPNKYYKNFTPSRPA
ncbi:MAG: hypothetical protein U9Q81_10080 [Pseudomonadota bacterium]|nr:hypothetical protein [Pseudomonadota bacterium]